MRFPSVLTCLIVIGWGSLVLNTLARELQNSRFGSNTEATCNHRYQYPVRISPMDSEIRNYEENYAPGLDAPYNLTVKFVEPRTQSPGSVTISWKYPSTKYDRDFAIIITFQSTDLRDETSARYTSAGCYKSRQRGLNYSVNVNLLTATKYRFSLRAINKDSSSFVIGMDYSVPPYPTIASGEKLELSQEGMTIKLKLPSIVNETLHTTVQVIVKGLPTCEIEQPQSEYFKKLLQLTKFEDGWIAANFTVPDKRPTEYRISNYPVMKNSLTVDCHLKPGITYVVFVVVFDTSLEAAPAVVSSEKCIIADREVDDRGTVDEVANDKNLIWLITIPILLVIGCLLLRFSHGKNWNFYARMTSTPSIDYVNETQVLQIETPAEWPFNCCLHPIKLKKFEENVKQAVESGELESQFKMLPGGMMRPYHVGNLPENKLKNRYENVMPYDDSRVVLHRGPQDSSSDYINASYIQGYCNERAYIATQSPMANTVVHFWSMVWQEYVPVICMLVSVIENGERMSLKYWPEVGRTVEYGDITILNVKQRVYADYTFRTLQITSRQESKSRKVEHLQYTGWPENGVPMYSHSIVEYLNELQAIPLDSGPIVVHCDGGVGRTGTIILCDICLRYMAADGTVDLYAEAKKMYHARANMLNNLQQYVLAHLMPTECLLLLSTEIPCREITKEKIEDLKKDLEVHMRRLAVSSWKDKALRPWEPLKLPIANHVAKNRFFKFMPVEHSLVSLKRCPKDDIHSDYISAVSVDGVKIKGQYLASQLPLPTTISDFWRLVAEKRVQLVVILQRPGPQYFACVDIIPQRNMIIPVSHIRVEKKMGVESNQYFTTQTLLLTDTSEKYPRKQNVTVLTCDNWIPSEDAEPPPPETLVALWSASERISRTEGPTVVLCHDGVTGCGLYLALSFTLERMAVEHECDVILAIRAIRRSRPEFVYSKAQFEYLYDAALEYLQEFETYANFT